MSDQIPIRRRRSYTTPFRLQLIAETRQPGTSIAEVARRHDMNTNVLFGWLRDPRYNGQTEAPAFLPVEAKASPLWRDPSFPERIDLTIELAGGARVRVLDEPSLIAALRAIRKAV